MQYIPWFGWIAIAGIFAGIIITVVQTLVSHQNARSSQLTKAIDDSAETNRALLAKLEGIDSRLSAVEKTLNDIP